MDPAETFHVLSFLDDRVRLLWAFSLLAHAQTLSQDVQRTICGYFGESFPRKLVAVFAENLRILDLADGTMQCTKPKIDFELGCFLYPISERIVVCVGGRETSGVASLDVFTQVVTPLRPMLSVRSFPGVVKVADLLYIFGGEAGGDLVESEVYSLGRRPSRALPNMQHPRSMFSPCVYAGDILLPGGSPVIESFHIHTETYTSLPVSFPFPGLASVSVIVGDELLSLCLLNQVGKWKLGSSGDFQVGFIDKIASGAMVYSSSPAVLHSSKLYFADVTGNFTIYDLCSNSLSSQRRDFL